MLNGRNILRPYRVYCFDTALRKYLGLVVAGDGEGGYLAGGNDVVLVSAATEGIDEGVGLVAVDTDVFYIGKVDNLSRAGDLGEFVRYHGCLPECA